MYYPGKLHRLKYENLTTNLLQETQILYQFLNLRFSNKTVQYLQKISSSTEGAKEDLFISANSRELSYKWRLDNTPSFVRSVDRNCIHLYERIGYVAASNNRILKNISIDLFNNNAKKFHFGLEIPT